MANFPTSLDALTNPTANDTLASVPHHTQHGTANDAIEAIEAKLGTTDSTPSEGTILVGTGAGTTEWVTSRSRNVKEYGVMGDGSTDDTAALETVFLAGGYWYVPPGDYRIAYAGDDTPGVDVTITASLRIECHPDARFYADGLDSNMFTVRVPTDGTGLPTEGITFDWSGGIIDQTLQKNTSSSPFTGLYEPPDVGVSLDNNGFALVTTYSTGGSEHHGIRRASFTDVRFVAGAHWESAGGGVGLYSDGPTVVSGCRFEGLRGTCVYFSNDHEDAIGGPFTAASNHFVDCFAGIAVRRCTMGFLITGNKFENVVLPISTDGTLSGSGGGGSIVGNFGERCQVAIGLAGSDAVTVMGNVFNDSGSFDEGAAAVGGDVLLEPCGVRLRGSSHCVVAGNHFNGLQAAVLVEYPNPDMLRASETSGAIPSDFATFIGNTGDGWGSPAVTECDDGLYLFNVTRNPLGTATLINTGTRNQEVRIDTSTNQLVFATQTQFASGSASAPTITRLGQSDLGMFFAANKVGISVSTVERFAATTAGVAFNGGTPGRPTITGSRGSNAALASLLTALATLGLITDGSS